MVRANKLDHIWDSCSTWEAKKMKILLRITFSLPIEYIIFNVFYEFNGPISILVRCKPLIIRLFLNILIFLRVLGKDRRAESNIMASKRGTVYYSNIRKQSCDCAIISITFSVIVSVWSSHRKFALYYHDIVKL